jgi:hypothetical protein
MAQDHLELEPGDLCHHGSNLLPSYRVIWIDGDKVWLRDVNSGQDAVVDTPSATSSATRSRGRPGWCRNPPTDPPA